MRGKKAETAIELLMTYGWVVLLILALFIVAYYSGYLDQPICSRATAP